MSSNEFSNHQRHLSSASPQVSSNEEDGQIGACAPDVNLRQRTVSHHCSISIVESVTSFLEANGAGDVEQSVLRNMAEALSKRLNDTSPGTLRDVTMDNSYGVGYRSPCVSLQQYQGSTSPAAQGRSVREFEEQMATLRKENFNLKLRLYFIEESLPGYQQASSQDGQETVVKQLIDTKVEMEILRKEIQEKQEILKEAAQAMNQMEKIQKETETKSQVMIDELKQRIQYLEMERDMDKSHNGEFMNDLLGRSEISSENLNALQRIRELEGMVNQSEDKIIDFQKQITKLDEILAKRDETIKEYEEKVKEMVFQNAEILEALENKEREVANAERILRGLRMSNADLKEDNHNLLDALKSAQENFRKEVTNIKLCERQMREQQDALSKMQSQRLREELQDHKSQLADKICMLQEAEEKLQETAQKLQTRTQAYEQACRSIQKIVLNSKTQQDEIHRLRHLNSMTLGSNASGANKENTNGTNTGLSRLECTGLCRSFSDAEALTELVSEQKDKFESIIEQQEATIKDLKSEVKKKTANLQNLVNKELWEKNREIERLTKMVNNRSATGTLTAFSPTTITGTNDTATASAFTNELQQSFSDMEYARALERNKLLQRKVDILIQRLDGDRSNETQLTQLRNEAREARNDADNAEKWRRECVDVCSVLSNRLEELAGFLNSLLKHKDVLGVLAADRRRAMRKAVDRSLDLSKSLNMTLSISGVSMVMQHDHSLAQLSNLSEILGSAVGSRVFDDAHEEEAEDDDNAFEESVAQHTFNSHEEQHALNSINALKAENRSLKKELLDKRRNASDPKKDRRSLPLPTATTLLPHELQSESEAWSEPDRKVSLARIGLEDRRSANTAASAKELTPATVAATAAADSDSEESDNHNQSHNAGVSAKSTRERKILEQQISLRDERILAVQCQLVEADNRLKREHLRVIDMTHELEQLRQRNEQLHADLIEIGSGNGGVAEYVTTAPPHSVAVDHSASLLLRHQIDEKTRSLERLQEERDRLAVEARFAEMQIVALKTEMDSVRDKHALAIVSAAEQERTKLDRLQREMAALAQQRLAEQERLHEQALARDYVTRTLYEECTTQLTALQRQHVEALRTIDDLTETETELKRTLVDSELAARSLRKQLDESTLQASRAVLERTKAHNERLNAEKRCAEITQQRHAAESERQTMQRQLVQLQRVQLTLEQQITAQAAAAALAEAQQRRQQQMQQINNQASSDCASHSGYTSEEVPLPAVNAATAGVATASTQRLNNSSPDLGIESDVGRVSSVETTSSGGSGMPHVTSKGAIKKESDEEHDENIKPSNLQQQQQQHQVADGGQHIPHDCAKVDLENAELRRKLIRNKRAFEDTLERLRLSNQRKAAQVERDIKNQILKTNNVLKKASSNIENNDL